MSLSTDGDVTAYLFGCLKSGVRLAILNPWLTLVGGVGRDEFRFNL